MSRYHLTGTSRALFRVFVAPNLAPRLPLQPQRAHVLARSIPFLPITSSRTKVGGSSKRPKRQALSDIYTFDNAITAHYINLIDESGKFIPNIHIDSVLPRIKRVTHHLLQISDGKYDEFGDPDPDHLPTCKIVSKIDLRNQYNKKLDIERKVTKGPSTKNLELNWAIAGGDLKHRLEKLKGFLREGRKVEILLGPKRRGKKATEAECQNVLKAVRDAVDECKGAGEMKREGTVGGVLTLVLQGRKLKEDKVDETEEESGVNGVPKEAATA
ncbi:hypothetical protein N0V90_001277 [Kalmusia sp. IMI 367209]|nr:hypothetical protein N0V90_001277 [Kalmusia sp. IMI 367209]